MTRVAGIYELTDRLDDTIRLRTELSASVDAVYAADASNSEAARDAAQAHHVLDLNYSKALRLDDADRERRRAAEIDEQRPIRFPQDPRTVLDRARRRTCAGQRLFKRGRKVEAAQRFQAAVDLRRKPLELNRKITGCGGGRRRVMRLWGWPKKTPRAGREPAMRFTRRIGFSPC